MRIVAHAPLWLFSLCLALTACSDDQSKRRLDASEEGSGGENPDGRSRECSPTKPCAPTGNPCLVATCNQGVCEKGPPPDGTSCDDMGVCTTDDVCKAGVCTGTPKQCDDGLTCSKDSCTEASGGCVADRGACACTQDVDCDDKNACNGVETCDPVARTCLNGVPVSCKTLDNRCNIGMCNPANGTCAAMPKPEGTACDDTNLCTQGDVCAQGVCGGTAVACAAQDQCHTTGVCEPSSGLCANPPKPDGNACEDGNLCTRGDACTAGACSAGTPTACVAIDECHAAGVCAPATGSCSTPILDDGTGCNDGSACTNGDICQAGTCQGAPLRCDDGIACTIDSCSETGGCTKDVRMCGCKANSDCDDGNACNGGESCNLQTGTCSAGTLKDCSGATNACNVGVCNASSGACEAKPRQNGTLCSDGSACTQTDACVNGSCQGQNSVVCTASDQCHATGTCDASTGVCSNPPKQNGAACNDGNACTQTDACVNGSCSGGGPVLCAATDQCHTAGSCNPQTGACSNPSKANGAACSDANACTQTDSCQSGICGGGSPVVCIAQGQCHAVGACDSQSGVCSNPAKVDGAACSDGNGCTQTDVCTAGACTGARPVICAAADDCHDVGLCDPANGTCSTPAKADGSACNDSNACTRADACTAGACKGGTPVACTASDACHVAGACDVASGLCSNPPAVDGTTCNDGSVCTTGDKCGMGQCTGTALACNDGVACTTDTCVDSQGGCTVDRSMCGCVRDADCNDGNACNGAETCNPQTFSCTRGVAVNCSSLDNACNTGACVPATGQCVATPRVDGTQCNDSNACTQADSCVAGSCRGSNPVSCPPPDQCHTAGVCNATTGVCSNPAKNDGATCSDGNACTQSDTCQTGACRGANPVTCAAKDQCHSVGLCNATTGACSEPMAPNGTRCADGNACTQTDVCQAGRCEGSNPIRCSASDQCHSAGTCNSQTGTCSNPEAPPGTQCNDNNACTTGEVCSRGACVPATTVACTAQGQCYDIGVCDQTTGRCSNPPKIDGTACNDNNACTTQENCKASVCAGGTAKACTAKGVCYDVGICDASTGVCSDPLKPLRTQCNDNNNCTQGDLCSNGQCQGTALSCQTLDQCHTVGTCNVTAGSCSNPTAQDGTLCTDPNACTSADRCINGTCQGTPITCAAPPACQQGGMCGQNGLCVYQNMPDRTLCDDLHSCTLGDACSSGQCSGSPRSNAKGDWNLTPAVSKGRVLSVSLDDFEKGSAVAGAFQNTVAFGNFTTSVSAGSTGAYVAFYATDKTVLNAEAVIEVARGGSLVISDLAVHADGSFVIVGAAQGGVRFPTDPKQTSYTTEGTELFVVAFDAAADFRWVRRGLRGNGVALAVDAYPDRRVVVIGTLDKTLVLETGSRNLFPLTSAGTFAAIYDNDGSFRAGATVATQALAGLKVAVSPESELAAVQGAGGGELRIGEKEGFTSLGASDVFLFALTPDLQVQWARQMGTSLDDDTGGIAAYPGQAVAFASFFHTTGTKAIIRSNSLGTRELHGFDNQSTQAHLVTFDKEGVANNAALVTSKNGLTVRAWDVAAQPKGNYLTVLGAFNVTTEVYSAVGFGPGPPKSGPDRTINNPTDGFSIFSARFDSDTLENTWAISLRGTNAGIGGNGADALITVHRDFSATATGIFQTTATFGDQATDTLSPGQGAFFMSHFNSAAQYDFCQ